MHEQVLPATGRQFLRPGHRVHSLRIQDECWPGIAREGEIVSANRLAVVHHPGGILDTGFRLSHFILRLWPEAGRPQGTRGNQPLNGPIEHVGVARPWAGLLIAEGEIDRLVGIGLADIGLETPAAVALVTDDAGGISKALPWHHLVASQVGSSLVGIDVFEHQVHPFEDVAVHPFQIVDAGVVSHVVGIQVVMVEEWRPAPDPLAIPVTDVLAGDEKAAAVVQVGDQLLVGIDVAWRAPGTGPDDHVVRCKLGRRGKIVGVGYGTRVIKITLVVQGPLVVAGDAVLNPSVGVNQQYGRGGLKGEVEELMLASGDAHLCHRLRFVAVAGGFDGVIAHGQGQGVVPTGIGAGGGRGVNRADGSRERLARPRFEHPTSQSARRRWLESEILHGHEAGDDLHRLHRLGVVAKRAGRDIVEAAGDAHFVDPRIIGGNDELVMGLTDTADRGSGDTSAFAEGL